MSLSAWCRPLSQSVSGLWSIPSKAPICAGRTDRMARSALLNVMVQAAIKAGRSLTKDFGEIENLQVSRKGPADFVSNADRRAEQICFEELQKARPTYAFLMEEGGEVAG